MVRLRPCLSCHHTSPYKLNHKIPSTLFTGYSSLLQTVLSLNKQWLADIRKALQIFPNGTFDRTEAALSFLQAAWCHGNLSFLFEKKDEVLFFLRMLWLFGCVAMLIDLCMTIRRKNLARSRWWVRISAADDVHGPQGGWPAACGIRNSWWHGWLFLLSFSNSKRS